MLAYKCVLFLFCTALHSPAKKQAKEVNEISGLVINCMTTPIISPPKPGSPIKKKTTWFTFGLITASRKVKCVDFCSQHHNLVKSLSNNKNHGLKITNFDTNELNECKLNVHSTVTKMEISDASVYDSNCSEVITINEVLDKEMESIVSVKCRLMKTTIINAKSKVYEYLIGDDTSTITFVSFEDLKMIENCNYLINDAKVSSYSNEKRIQHNPSCLISKLEKSVIKSQLQKHTRHRIANVLS